MMNATELRIGNYVWFECDKLSMTTNGVVVYIREDGIYTGGNNIGKPILMVGLIDQWGKKREEHIIDLESIPLTPEILAKYGFYKDNYGLFEKVKENAPYISGCKIELWTKEYEGKWQFAVGELDNLHDIAECTSLHQLQNLYFALTQTELQIKL